MSEPIISPEGRTFEVPPKHVREKTGILWSASRELEICLHERVTGIPREHCRIDPTTRDGEPQFPPGGQCGHDFAPPYLTDPDSGWFLMRWLRQEFPHDLRVDITGRKTNGKFTCWITHRVDLSSGRDGFSAEADGREWYEALARALHECLLPPEIVPCAAPCSMCRGWSCRWCMTGFTGTERTCSHRKRRRHMRNPEKEPVE